MKRICVIGLGYIGLPFSLLLAQKREHEVTCFDINSKKINQLSKGTFFFEENTVNLLYKKKYKSIKFSNKIIESDYYFLCVPTPLSKNKKCDLTYIYKAADILSNKLKKNNFVVLESTVAIGDTKKIKRYIERKRPDLINKINFCYVPEKSMPGATLKEMKNNDRFIGCDPTKFKYISKIYRGFSKGDIKQCTIEEAEASKLVENAFRDYQIAFSIFLYSNLKNKKISFKNVVNICNTHPRVNILKPSIGVGGHCIPIDPYFLNFKKIDKINLINNTRLINNNRTKKISMEILKFIKTNKNTKICLWGLGYKPGTMDIRESPSLKIINFLKKKNCNFNISDPFFDKIKIMDLKIISPKKAMEISSKHIILNLEKSFIKKIFNKNKFLFAEDL
jgi:UDP-N-acetyl-D-mannosaminuronic acid dehydrogenase